MQDQKKIVAAVSGGVDSVVMLHYLTTHRAKLVIAHFDHGIREESAADARFTAGLAQKYNLPFELGKGRLGSKASEDQARQARHSFLREMAEKHNALIATAHHRDDVIETAIINILRGTRWRGMSSLRERNKYVRPLLTWTKEDIYKYALEHKLEWVEDPTNVSDQYLRNRVRYRLAPLMKQRGQYEKFEKIVYWFYANNPQLIDGSNELFDKIVDETRDHIALPVSVLGRDKVVGRELLYKALKRRSAKEISSAEIMRLYDFAMSAKHGDKFNQFPPLIIQKANDWLLIN